jgi:hypothetical protein
VCCVLRRASVGAVIALAACFAGAASAGKPETRGDERLESLRKSGDLQAQRRHAWDLLVRLAPELESWYAEGAVFSRDGERAGRGIRGFSRSSASALGPASDGADASVLSFTLYNPSAYEHIRRNQLHLISKLEQFRVSGAADDTVPNNRAIPPFPPDAMVVKTVWWPAARDRITALPVWDPEHNPARTHGNPYTSWQRIVAIDARSGSRPVRRASLEFAGRTLVADRVLRPHAFHHVTLDSSLAKRLNADRDAARVALIALGRPVEAGDSLVLIGASLASREIPDWVWATFWWHDRAQEGPFAAQRPPSVSGPWRSFLMQVAFDSDSPRDEAGEPHACFNPWLEARFPDGGHGGGTVSNCVSCHRRASYPAIDFLPVTRGAPDLTGDSAYASGRLRTGFLWSIAMHALPE